MEENQVFLSTLPAAPRERRLAAAILVLSVAVFVFLAPFAKTQLAPVWAFIPIYESSLVINDLITAVLLLSQYLSFRSRALFVLSCGYLFTAFTTVAHALTFPGLFAPTGLLGAGPQSTAWLYMFWHGTFPLFVMAYAHMKAKEGTRMHTAGSPGPAVLGGLAVILAVVCGFTLLVTQGHALLPAIMQGNRHTPVMIGVVSTVWMLSLVALVMVWRQRPHSVLDIWLMVTMCAWLIDIALSAVLNGGRFDLGFYAGRIYGLLAASFVLLVLLVESGMLYAQLVELTAALRRLTSIDPLTGIANRRVFDGALDREWRRSVRAQTPLSLLLIDVDHFKLFNDTYGHVAGDECLRQVASALAGTARRAGDVVARYGGEEFVVLLPQTHIIEAQRVAQRVRDAVISLAIPHDMSSASTHVTVSIGVSSVSPSLAPMLQAANDATSPAFAELVDVADKALYVAKTSGRNRVSVGMPPSAMEAPAAA
ncbi:GGDEF domain-containing protein [Herbaspirillum sp. HC18]|nr:GGDEF domain-containing protein [Herbaspirillum sp. HC18]